MTSADGQVFPTREIKYLALGTDGKPEVRVG